MLRKLLIVLILNVISILAVDRMTFKYSSGESISGNGNPGFIALAVGLFLFIILLFYVGVLIMGFNSKSRSKLVNITLPVTSILILGIMIMGESSKIRSLSKNLNGFTNNKDSVVYRFGWINQYTNNLFFNGYIFFAGVALTVFIVWVVTWSFRSKL
ncbi:hypothetical protein [Paenibacillus sp. FSL P4-0184]|uniref:hypothetical protein n=1 Tax=Paenibacillus sp. FSL P4-0184 TaxID=2921632 RepID=UPI0030F703E8